MQQIDLDCEKLSPNPLTCEVTTENDVNVIYFTWLQPRKCCKKWIPSVKNNLPYGILLVSFLEIVCYIISNEKFQQKLRFEPTKMHEVWRFITYMFLHEDWIHLSLNVIIQILFAYFLEMRHSRIRILVLYLAGGITAVLGATCFHPDLVIGASGGVYALLISHVADVIMNYENISYKAYRCVSILIIVLSDVAYNIIHFISRKEPVISWGAHVTGGVSGLLLGLVFFRQDEWIVMTRKIVLFWSGLLLYLILFTTMVIVIFQIKKCTPPSLLRIQYVYFC